MNNQQRNFAQGARCGHIEGNGRAGSYVLGEELEPSIVASRANCGREDHPTWGQRCEAWARGYRIGYKLAASGEALARETVEAELPDTIE